jgi:calcineurin-like phosphoesterase family protein
MFEISSTDITFNLSDVQKKNSNLEEKVYEFLSTINNSVEYVRGNNDTNKVSFFFKDEISEDVAEDFEDFLKKK